MKVMVAIANDIYHIPDSEVSKHVSIQCAAHIKKTVNGMFILFPKMRPFLKGIRYTKRVTSSFDPFDRELVISINGLSGSVPEAHLEISRGNKPGFAVHDDADKAFTTLIVHEMAHCIDHWIRHEFKSNDDDLIEYQEGKKQLRDRLGYPSEYAKKNLNEWFAEQFTFEYMGTGHKALINFLIQWRDRQ